MSTPTISQLAATLRAFGITSVRQMEEITTELLCRMPTAGAINGALSGDGDPTGAYFPVFIGQLYHDTTADTYYRSTGLDVYDWVAIGGGASYQDMQVSWTPTNLKLGELIGLFAFNADMLPGITTLKFHQESFFQGIDIENLIDVTSIEYTNAVNLTLPSKIYITGTALQEIKFTMLETVDGGIDLEISTSLGGQILFPALISEIGNININTSNSTNPLSGELIVSAPLLQTVTGSISFYNMESISLPSLVTASGGWDSSTSSILSSVSFPNFLPTNGTNINFNGCALDLTSVNHILARAVANAGYVSGTINLAGGTSVAPSGQGATDKTTLTGRGVTVITN